MALGINKGNGKGETLAPRGAHPGTCASVNTAFRVRISPRGMGIAAEGEER